MLGTLVAAAPLVVTLAAAIYFIRRSLQQRMPTTGFTDTAQGWSSERDSGYNSGAERAGRARTTRRRRIPPEDAENRTRHRQRASHSPEEDLVNECSVCFETEGNIELYPCGHTNVCIDCVNKIITDLDRSCPFCRRYIQAYTVVST